MTLGNVYGIILIETSGYKALYKMTLILFMFVFTSPKILPGVIPEWKNYFPSTIFYFLFNMSKFFLLKEKKKPKINDMNSSSPPVCHSESGHLES